MRQGVTIFNITHTYKTLSYKELYLDISSYTCSCESGSELSEFINYWMLVSSVCSKSNCVSSENHVYTLLPCLIFLISPIGGLVESCYLLIVHSQRLSSLSTLGGWVDSCLHMLICTTISEVTAVLYVFDVNSWLINACRYFQIIFCTDSTIYRFDRSTNSYVKQFILNYRNAKRVSFEMPQTMNWPSPIDIATTVLWCTPASRCEFYFMFIVRISRYLKEEQRLSNTHNQCNLLATKPILVSPTYASFFTTYSGSDQLDEYHVGISIIYDSYIVCWSIGIPIIGSITENYDRICISTNVTLALIATLYP